MHKMNAKKSADYCNLIENVKNKYRKNPIYAKSLTLGWCDLRQGEDLCQEINLWTYWQVFAVGYNNQGTTEIEYDISRETIFLHKENAELYLLMCNKFNNIDHELISEAEFRDIHVRFVKEIKKLDKDDKKNVIDIKTQFDSIITELDMIQKESKYVGTSKVFQVERGRVYNADEFEASGLKNITKYDESSKEQSNKENKAR